MILTDQQIAEIEQELDDQVYPYAYRDSAYENLKQLIASHRELRKYAKHREDHKCAEYEGCVNADGSDFIKCTCGFSGDKA